MPVCSAVMTVEPACLSVPIRSALLRQPQQESGLDGELAPLLSAAQCRPHMRTVLLWLSQCGETAQRRGVEVLSGEG